MAKYLHSQIQGFGVDVFMASVSLKAGQRWSDETWQNLRKSESVFFLATQAACNSAYVQQELGAALMAEKNIIPLIWGIKPEDLPGWIKQIQGINITGLSMESICEKLETLMVNIKQGEIPWKLIIAVIIGAIAIYWIMKNHSKILKPA
jgi:hypothetical protein